MLADDALIARFEELAADERRRLPELLQHLAEIDDRKSLQPRGYSSTFDYCVRHLQYSEDEAYRRIHAARAAKRFPEIYGHLADGRLSLTTLSRIAASLKPENRAELLAAASGKPLRDVERLVAPLIEARAANRIRPIKRKVETLGPLFEPRDMAGPPAVVDRYQFFFEGSVELKEAIDRVRARLSNKYPFGQLEDIVLELAIDWLKRHDQADAAPALLVPRPIASDRVPNWARRVVWKRDGGRCAFVAKDGTRCESRRGLEIDHIVPRSLGGAHSPENLRLLCRPHNDSERRRLLGEGEFGLGEQR